MSQQFSHSSLRGEGQSLILRCTTDDFVATIMFQLDSITKGGCLADGLCQTAMTGYKTPTQQGTGITEMTITSCNSTRDTGRWTCSYGASTSSAVILSSCKYYIMSLPVFFQNFIFSKKKEDIYEINQAELNFCRSVYTCIYN